MNEEESKEFKKLIPQLQQFQQFMVKTISLLKEELLNQTFKNQFLINKLIELKVIPENLDEEFQQFVKDQLTDIEEQVNSNLEGTLEELSKEENTIVHE